MTSRATTFTGPLTLTIGNPAAAVLRIRPGDTILFHMPPGHTFMEAIESTGAHVKRLYPEHRVIVLPHGADIRVARESPATDPP